MSDGSLKLRGRVAAVLGDNIDTDLIYPGRYLNVTDREKTAEHLFELAWPEIAASFARIFFRNAINLGLSAVVAPDASSECSVGDELEINLVNGEIRNLTQDREVRAAALDPRAVALLESGGLIPYLKRKYAA